LCSSELAKNYFKERTGYDADVLRLATNPKRFNPQVKPSRKYACDYCFTGNYWGSNRHIELFDPQKTPYRFAVFGSGWANNERFKQNYWGVVPYKELNRVYASCRLLIDDANHATEAWGSVNSRVYDAIASGVLVITNGAIGSAETFDKILPVYNSADDLLREVTYFLSHEEDRASKVRALQDQVLSRHTYSHRAKQLKEIFRQKSLIDLH
jgi:spore maturation protein CgeB